MDIAECKHPKTEEDTTSIPQRLALALAAGQIGAWDLNIATDQSWRSIEHDRIFGYEIPLLEWGSEAFFSHICSEDREGVKQAFARAYEVGFLQFECRIVRADKALRWIVGRGEVVYNAHRTPVQMRGVVQDITERKHTEEALRVAEERFRLLVDGVKDYVIFTLDPAGCIASWNKGSERLKGYSASEVVGKHLSIFYTEEDIAVGKAEFDLASAERDGEYAGEGWRVRKDGSRFWARAVITALRENDGTLRGFSKFTRDMTAYKKSEEDLKRSNDLLIESNRELEAFSYTAAHDLRAPLRHMHGFVGLLRQSWYEKLDDDGRHCLDKISSSSKDMGTLLDDLLNFSRLGRVDLQQHRVNLNHEIIRIRQELQPELTGRNLTWEIGALPEVQGDPTLLHQVLFNLVANAVKYTRKRENARIQIGTQNGPEDSVTVFVRDNGAGFEMQYVDKLFGVFQRLHKARDFEGTGIGLAIVRRIVERHRGRAWAEGVLDQGATFYISLPTKGTDKNG